MINLYYHNDNFLIFDAEDWNILRRQHRIIGQLIGHTGQNEVLPLLLSPEEANLLIKKEICQITTSSYKSDVGSQELHKTYLNKIYEDEKIILKEERKKEINEVIKRIIKGKKDKGITDISEEDIIKIEMNKLEELKKENMITATYSGHLSFLKEINHDTSLSSVLKNTTETKCAVFQDLWERGFYVTTGQKFGGDFLVYLGDPIACHAVYIIKCVEDIEKEIPASQIVMYGRFGNSVKKSFILASLLPDDTVKYISLSWMEIK